MKTDNPLSLEFLQHYPVEAARVLEQVLAESVAALFNELSVERVAPVAAAMLPDRAATCLSIMQAALAAKLLSDMPVSPATRIYRLLPPDKQNELSSYWPEKIRNRMRRFMNFASVSAGDLMDPVITMLPSEISVAEAIRRIERLHHPVSCEIYIVDNAHHLLGLIELGKLMISNHHVRLRDIMSRKIQPISAHASAETALSHPAWATRRRLPVVERDNTLIGLLDYIRLQEITTEESVNHHDSMDGLLSMAELYWLSLIQLLNSVFSIASTNKEKNP